MSSVRSRALDLVETHLRTQLGPALKTISQDLRGFTELGVAGCPALFIVTTETPGGVSDHQASGHVRETLPFHLIGYAASPSGSANGVKTAREDLLQLVLNALYVESEGQVVLMQALILDAKTHGGNGCIGVRHISPPATDGGFTPPFGMFMLPCEGILHYRRGQA